MSAAVREELAAAATTVAGITCTPHYVQLSQPGLAMDCVAGLLRAATAHGDHDRMNARAEEIEGWIEEHGVEGIEDPIRTYVNCARAHLALGNDGAAAASMQAAHDLLATRAERITESEARRSYLEQVPANRAVMEWMSQGKRFTPNDLTAGQTDVPGRDS